jgi:hypothetical protein
MFNASVYFFIKVLVKEPSGGQLSSHFMKYDITNNRNVKIEPEVQIDQSGKNIYLLSGSQVFSLIMILLLLMEFYITFSIVS